MSPNVLILTTSNITGAIDGAFVDRADIVQYIGPPNQAAIYQILFSAIQVQIFWYWEKSTWNIIAPVESSILGVDEQGRDCCWGYLDDSQVSLIPCTFPLFFNTTFPRELELTEFNQSDATSTSLHLWRIAQLCQKAQLSGRALRKVLSFLVASEVKVYCPGPLLGICLVLRPQEEAHSKGVFGELGEGGEEATGREGGSGQVW